MARFNPGMGLGLERIGLAALKAPKTFTVVLLLLTALAGSFLPSIRFEGDITAVLPEDSEAYKAYFAQRDEFRDFSRDITVVIRSDRLMTASGLEDLRFLQLDTAVNDFVDSAVTIFSVPDPDPETGRVRNLFPDEIGTDEQAAALVSQALRRYPQASALISPERNLAIMQVTLASGLGDRDDAGYAQYQALREAIDEAKPDDFEVAYTGLTPIGVTIVDALVTDQLRLTVIGLLLGTALAFYIFRSLAAAAICSLAPALTAIWSLGVFGAFDVPITYLSTVLPTLALILAFADSIVLYYRWQGSNAVSGDFGANLEEALRRVGPASALTSITTVLAFLSFITASGSALKTFALLGMAVVSIAFLAVIAGLPIACHWATRAGMIKAGRVRQPAFSRIGERFFGLSGRHFLVVSAVALAATAAVSVTHFLVRAEYRITDYLPYQAEAREAEALANDVVGGRALIFASVPAAVPGEALARANIDRLAEVEAAAAEVFSTDRVLSLRTIAGEVKDDAALAALAAEFEAAPGGGNSYVSKDGSRLLVSIRISSDQSIEETAGQIDALRARLDGLSYGRDVVITGFDVLMAREFTHLIDQLRTSLLMAVFLGVGVVGLLARSLWLAVAVLVPNLLSIFSVEAIFWLRGGGVNISEVIALTIAFGIAIDNAVHLVNVYRTETDAGADPAEAARRATVEVGPALAASCAIICVSTLVTQASVLPMVPILGGLIVATLVVAFCANLAVLPANILTIEWLRHRLGPARVGKRGEGE